MIASYNHYYSCQLEPGSPCWAPPKTKAFSSSKTIGHTSKRERKKRGGALQNSTIIEQHLATVASFLVEKKCEPNRTKRKEKSEDTSSSEVKFSTRQAEHAGP
jgi:hypothetical protein